MLTPGTIHRNESGQEHQWEKFQNAVCREDQKEDHYKCAECHRYLGGKIITAIYCLDCQQYYHVNCFQVESDASENMQPEAEDGKGKK